MMKEQIAGAVEGGVDAPDAEEEGAGEDVFLNPIDPAFEFEVSAIGDSDVLQADEAAGFEDFIDFGEVGFEVAIADGLHHFDGSHFIELSGDESVVG